MTLKASLLEFLRDGIAKVDPQREKERGAALRQRLQADPYDEVLFRDVIGELPHRVDLFTRCVHLASLYVDESHSIDEPGLGAALVRSTLAFGPYNLSTLLESAKRGYFWTALAQVLPKLELDTNAVLELGRHCRPEGNLPSDSMRAWAEKHPDLAALAINQHLGELVRLSLARHDCLVDLVVGAVAGGATLAWRDQVLAQLLGNVDARVQALAMQLTCWAWPGKTAIETRHAYVLDTVAAFPPGRAQASLVALRSDALSHPQETIDTVLDLVATIDLKALDVKTATTLSGPALDAISTGLHQLRSRGASAVLDNRVRDLVMVTSPLANRAVDSILSEVHKTDPEAAYELLASWLSRFAAGIVDVAMGDLLSLLVHDAGPGLEPISKPLDLIDRA